MRCSLSRVVLAIALLMVLTPPALAVDIDAAPTVAPSNYLQQGGPETGVTPRHSPRPPRIQTNPSKPRHSRASHPTQAASNDDHVVSYNRRSHKFHERSCRYWNKRAATQMLESQAIAEGGKPCHLCH
jgi:hypothetical protein